MTDSVADFVGALASLFSSEKIKRNLRITPKGLFVHHVMCPEVVTAYREWLSIKTAGAVNKSEQKTFKRIFGEAEPPLYYLIEAKQCLLGHLVPIEIPNPQQFNLPYYLGTLTAASDYIHPRDPIFLSVPNLEAASHQEGIIITVTIREQRISATTMILKEFARLAARSTRLCREFPKAASSQRDAALALSQVFQQLRQVKRERILVPTEYRLLKQERIFRRGALILIVRGESALSLYELNGSNYFMFLSNEWGRLHGQLPKKQLGAFEIYPPKKRLLGKFQLHHRSYSLTPHAFLNFVERVPLSTLSSSLPLNYTVQNCLEIFSDLFQRAQEIEKSRIARHLSQHLVTSAVECRISDQWLFIMDRDRAIQACIDRAAPHGESEPKRARSRRHHHR